jgi:general secretion pathway protein G
MNSQARTARLAARASRGMTLIEIMVVLAIIGLIVGGIGVMAFSRFADAQVDTARNQTVQIQQLVEQYMVQKKGKCPKTLQDLKASGIASKLTKDPWGNDYVMKCPGEHGPADITSNGPDGEADTEDDIRSWQDEAGAGGDKEEEG